MNIPLTRSTRDAPFPFCITPQAHADLLATVGSRPPETGAKGFGPMDKMGVDIVEFDVNGSARASGGVYAPDEEWGDARREFWLDQPDDRIKVWTSDIHSHPGQMGTLSPKAGDALGDLGYIEAVFAQNETMQYFATPILTNTGRDKKPEMHPWIISRDDPLRPMRADLVICAIHGWPARVFNPEWLERIESGAPPSFKEARLADLLGVPVIRLEEHPGPSVAIAARMQAVTFIVVLPVGFPRVAPELSVAVADEEPTPVPLSWARGPVPYRRGVARALARPFRALAAHAADHWLGGMAFGPVPGGFRFRWDARLLAVEPERRVARLVVAADDWMQRVF